MADRILSGSDQYGGRIITVDGQGNGDHLTIQAAINEANSQSPAADERWLVLVAPGEYQEALVLYDYVDVSGYAPGYSVSLQSPAGQAAITNFAECVFSNISIGGANDPITKSDTFSGSMYFINCMADDDNEENIFFQITSGTVFLDSCQIKGAGRIVRISGGALAVYDSVLDHYHTNAGADTEDTIHIAGVCVIRLYRSTIQNTSPEGAAIDLNALPASFIAHQCIFRKADTTYSIETTVAPTIYLGACVANAAIHTSILGTHDVQVDANY